MDEAEREQALEDARMTEDGEGWVFFNDGSGEEYSPEHPVESGECPDATNIRKSTGQEDTLYHALQVEFDRANRWESLAATQAKRVEKLEVALRDAVRIAGEAAAEWDKAPEGMKAGKLLIALSGGIKGYRADIDGIHAALTETPTHGTGGS